MSDRLLLLVVIRCLVPAMKLKLNICLFFSLLHIYLLSSSPPSQHVCLTGNRLIPVHRLVSGLCDLGRYKRHRLGA